MYCIQTHHSSYAADSPCFPLISPFGSDTRLKNTLFFRHRPRAFLIEVNFRTIANSVARGRHSPPHQEFLRVEDPTSPYLVCPEVSFQSWAMPWSLDIDTDDVQRHQHR